MHSHIDEPQLLDVLCVARKQREAYTGSNASYLQIVLGIQRRETHEPANTKCIMPVLSVMETLGKKEEGAGDLPSPTRCSPYIFLAWICDPPPPPT